MTAPKPITVSQLIARLNLIKRVHGGSIPVWYSSDDEGNFFGPVFQEAGIMNMDEDGQPTECGQVVCVIN
jgi:hypothetical protein